MSGEELEYIHAAFESNYIAPVGPMVDAFEREFADYVGIPHCLALASGTSAMHLAMRELGVAPGDEVLASTLTFIGSVSPAIHLGASVAFIDSDARTWNMDPELLAEELDTRDKGSKLPKAVVPTDIYGQCADLQQIKAICQPYGIPVIADAAEAMGALYTDHETTDHGPQTGDGEAVGSSDALATDSQLHLHADLPANWRHAGFGAQAAVFSFNGNKIMTTSGGGMLASADEGLIEHARKLSQQARDKAPHYQHSEIGYNYRLSNVLAAIGRAQLKVLDDRVERKRQIFRIYESLLDDLPGVQFMPEAPRGRSNRWLSVMLLDPEQFGATNEHVRDALEAENIESRPVWKPMHLQPVFQGCRIRGGAVSEYLFRHGLCLPSGSAMTDPDVERVAGVVRRCFGALVGQGK
jgi:dTDP-4-amino-4,6-dideoxygalactose transaminase